MSITAPGIGVFVQTSETPPPTGVPTNTATAFVIGRGDQGVTNSYTRLTSITNFITAYGARSTTNAVAYDSCDMLFRAGVPQIYFGRVTGPAPVNATLTLNDAGSFPTMVVTADWPGVNGNALYIVVTVVSLTYSITLQDSLGNVIAQSPFFTTQAQGIAWSATAPYITITAATGGGATTNIPKVLAATPLVGGTDDYSNATIEEWQDALELFPFALGPGQVLAPGQTNTTLVGIWSALLFHAYTYNRFACLDMDSTSAAALVAQVATFNVAYYASWGMFDQPSAQIPGVTPGTLRTVPASAVRAGLCAMADATGNPNRAAAGRKFPIPYVVSFNWYLGPQPTDADVLTMNQAGVNTFELRYGVLESFGFSTPVLQTADPIYWQASHSRLRMALVANAYSVGEPFVFAQIDGKGVQINAFGTAITAMLKDFYDMGALYGATPTDAFVVNVGPTVNTIQTIAAGELKAACSVRMSPFAEYVEIDLAAVPITQPIQ